MKRDLDLIRKIVLAVEAAPGGYADYPLKIEGYSDEQIGYHSYLVVDAGLAEGEDITTMGSTGPEWMIQHLTHEGHDFADAARDESRWKRATGLVKQTAGDATLDVIKEVLVKIVKGAIGLP